MYISFFFVWRISAEKGITLILSAVELLVDQWYHNFHVDFVGSGVLVDSILDHHLYWKHLFYHGRLSKEENIALMKKSTYVLMPSTFLETFWLVALDWLACGVPVVAQKKWGLTPFIIDDALTITSDHSLEDIMRQLIEVTTNDYLTVLQKKARIVAAAYTPMKRFDRFWQLSNNCKKLLIVSDYAVDIWWIENYLFQIKKRLETNETAVDVYGKTKGLTWWRRKIDLAVAGVNVWWVVLLWKKMRKNVYDLVWLHSVQRRRGRCGIAFLWINKKQPVWCMYHDFWLLHPFPSHVYEVSQLDRAQSFMWYLAEGKNVLWSVKRYIGWWVLIIAKYFYSSWLFFLLGKVVDTHVVPSAYMLPYVQHKLPSSSAVVEFPHFVSHAQDVHYSSVSW